MLTDIGKHLWNWMQTTYPENIKPFYKKLENTCFMDQTALLDELSAPLFEGATEIAIRAVIEELHQYAALHEDEPGSKEEIYVRFIHTCLENDKNVNQLMNKYPELKKCILGFGTRYLTYICQFFDHLQKDKDHIEKYLLSGREFHKITSIHTNLSDRHHGGKMVIRAETDSGDVLFYKPHSVKNEIFFQKLSSWFMGQCGLCAYEYPVLDKGRYGWVKAVSAKECETQKQAEQYFFRYGILLCLVWLFGVGDLHGENIIAHGEYPVFVDMEFFPGNRRLGKPENARDKTADLLADSLIYSGALPLISWDLNGQGVSLSAIGADGEVTLPVKVPVVVDEETSRMHIEYTYPRVYFQGRGVRLHGKTVNPSDYVSWICQGFLMAWEMIRKKKTEFKTIAEPVFKLDGRYLIRQTQVYGMYIKMSYHPSALKSDGLRRTLLDHLESGYFGSPQCKNEIINYEKACLLQGDIPVFYVQGDSKNLAGGNHIFKDFFDQTARELFYQRMESLNEGAVRQMEWIQVSMALLKKHGENSGTIKDVDMDFQAQSQSTAFTDSMDYKIMERLLANGIYDDLKESVCWTSVSFLGIGEAQWRISPMNMYLYDGIGGIAVYVNAYICSVQDRDLACADNLCEENFMGQVKTLKKCLDHTLFAYTKQGEKGKLQSRSTGLWCGEGSVVYTYLLLWKISGDEQYKSFAIRHSGILYSLLKEDRSYDLLSGNGGAIVVFLHMYREFSDEIYLEWAKEAAKILLEHAIVIDGGMGWQVSKDSPPLSGMAHGNSGFILAFTRLAEATKNEQYLKIIGQLLDYENRLYDSRENNWKDLRGTKLQEEVLHLEDLDKMIEKSPAHITAWCHGAGGIALSRMEILEKLNGSGQWYAHIKDLAYKDLVHGILKLEVSVQKAEDDRLCLCHGWLGNLSILESLSKANIKDMEQISMDFWETLEAYVKKQYISLYNSHPEEYFNMGFMTGITGMGYALLKQYNMHLPDVLRAEL